MTRTDFGKPITTVRGLLAAVRAGGRLVRYEAWQLTAANQWNHYLVVERDGLKRQVMTRVAIAAERRGIIRSERETKQEAKA